MVSFVIPVVLALALWAPSVEGRLEASSKNTFHHSDSERPLSRDLLSLPRPFDYYNEACRDKCDGVEEHRPFLNACPKCPEKYSACNSCCYGGASSLKMRWHGCDGNLTLTTPLQAYSDCNTDLPESNETTARFIDCACLDVISDPGIPKVGCGLYESIEMNHWISSSFFDVCLVSVIQLSGDRIFHDLSSPLPEVIGIEYSSFENEHQTDTSQKNDSTTYFDTTCYVDGNAQVPYPYPIFPGYGKFPGTCPGEGFIDLEVDDAAPLPDKINHFYSSPPSEALWFEFLDGTSSGFWPESHEIADHFNPKFSVCACNECQNGKSVAPIETSTTVEPTFTPTMTPTRKKKSPPTPTRPVKTKGANPPTAKKGRTQSPTFVPRANKGPPPPGTKSPVPSLSSVPSVEPSHEDCDHDTVGPTNVPTVSSVPTLGTLVPPQQSSSPSSLPSLSSSPSSFPSFSRQPSWFPSTSIAPSTPPTVSSLPTQASKEPSQEPTQKSGGNPGPPAPKAPTISPSGAPSDSEEPTQKDGGNPGPPAPKASTASPSAGAPGAALVAARSTSTATDRRLMVPGTIRVWLTLWSTS